MVHLIVCALTLIFLKNIRRSKKRNYTQCLDMVPFIANLYYLPFPDFVPHHAAKYPARVTIICSINAALFSSSFDFFMLLTSIVRMFSVPAAAGLTRQRPGLTARPLRIRRCLRPGRAGSAHRSPCFLQGPRSHGSVRL